MHILSHHSFSFFKLWEGTINEKRGNFARQKYTVSVFFKSAASTLCLQQLCADLLFYRARKMSASRTSTQRHVASTSSTFSASSQPKPSASSQSSASSKPNVPTQQRPKSATAPQSAPIITPDRLASTMGTKVDEWLRSALSTLETTSKSDVCTCDFSADAFPADG